MALAEAILVCLVDRPMTGYDLAKNFDASIGFFWRASHQQIYQELGRLRDKGYVESREIAQHGKPNRIVHTITTAGHDALLTWSKRPSRQPSIKDDLLVKFYALGEVDMASLKDQLTIRIEQHQSRLSKYQRIKDRFYREDVLDMNHHGKLIALEFGISDEKHRITALQKVMIALTDLDMVNKGSMPSL